VTISPTWGGDDAGRAEARKGTPAPGPEGRAVPAGRGTQRGRGEGRCPGGL